jgi:hypothetical protein
MNSAALRTARELHGHFMATVYEQLAEFPSFNPDDDHEPLPAAVVTLRAEIAAADAVLFCTPEYAGTLPGSFKTSSTGRSGAARWTGSPWRGSTSPPRDVELAPTPR